MYVGELEGKKMYLSNGDMKKLLERFDVKNVAEYSLTRRCIDICCPLCIRFNGVDCNCEGCTFHKFQSTDVELMGCTQVIEAWTGMSALNFPVTLSIDNVYWLKSKNRSARKFIGTIRKRLLTFENTDLAVESTRKG